VQNVSLACAPHKVGIFDSQLVKSGKGTKVLVEALEGEDYPATSAPVDLRSGSLQVSPTQVSATVCESSPQKSQRPKNARAPCKLITLLAENPAIDITQMSISTNSETRLCETNKPENDSSNGIECSAAYSMLMRHATSGEKMDRIAAALESGCTPSATGGCRVKKSVVWRTLDEECN
jgi:hypothetical protein